MSALASTPAKYWTIPPRDAAAEKRLQDELKVPSIVAAVLVNRGFSDPEAAYKFLNPSLDDLGSPKKLPDYDAAAKHILGARERKEKIFVHGDYDVDGVTSTALLTRFLQSIGCDVVAHVPHRMKEGYGIHLNAVDAAVATGAKLFLTCDCGVSAFDQIDRAKELGMTVVVTDHHSIGECLPDAHAMINPHRTDSEYPYAELSGVGVAFRLCEGLTEELGFKKEHYRRAFLDLTVLGTVADVMPLTGENRIITRHGLKYLLESKKIGLKALLRESKVLEECNGVLKCYHIGFMLGPRLNATGRIDDAARALDLLLTTDEPEAAKMASEIEAINTERRETQKRTVEEAVQQVIEKGLHERHAIVVGHESWHPGIIGLVASRLVEQFRRPAYVVSISHETGMAKGSARSIPGFNLADSIRAFPELLSGGGHAAAAGFATELDKFEEVARAFESYAQERLTEDDFVLKPVIDAEVDARELSMPTLEALEQLEPFGQANPEPLFCSRGITFARIIPTKNPSHSRVTLRAGDGPLIQGIAFSQGERLMEFEPGFKADVLFQPCINEWRGARSMQWDVKSFVPLS